VEARFNYAKAAPGAFEAMLGLEKYLHQCGLEEALLHLIKLRVSQINGCAYCLDMHWKDLIAIGENEHACTRWTLGANARTTMIANGPP
jgi:AhpD family alkylhydroperoxidase